MLILNSKGKSSLLSIIGYIIIGLVIVVILIFSLGIQIFAYKSELGKNIIMLTSIPTLCILLNNIFKYSGIAQKIESEVSNNSDSTSIHSKLVEMKTEARTIQIYIIGSLVNCILILICYFFKKDNDLLIGVCISIIIGGVIFFCMERHLDKIVSLNMEPQVKDDFASQVVLKKEANIENENQIVEIKLDNLKISLYKGINEATLDDVWRLVKKWVS